MRAAPGLAGIGTTVAPAEAGTAAPYAAVAQAGTVAAPAPTATPPVAPTPPRTTSRMRRGPDMTDVWVAFKQTGDVALRNRLVEHYHYIVQLMGKRIAARLPRSIDVADLRSAGVFGLMRAIENFDLERGTPFESYCATRVRGAILDELRAQDWVPRLVRHRAGLYERAVTKLRRDLGREPDVIELADYLEVSRSEAAKMQRESNLVTVYNLAPADDGDDDSRVLRRLDVLMDRESELPFERLVAHDLARSLQGVLVGPERTVIALYYHEGLTMKEIGRVMSISESRVCQIHTKTLKKLKHILHEITHTERRRLLTAN